jgi:hypothetical protein
MRNAPDGDEEADSRSAPKVNTTSSAAQGDDSAALQRNMVALVRYIDRCHNFQSKT